MGKAEGKELISVELSKEEKELFQFYCFWNKTSMSEVVRNAIAPDIEKARALKESLNKVEVKY